MIDDSWTHDPSEGFLALLGGIWWRDRGNEREFAFLAEERHSNRNGVVHGGMLMTFVDRSFAIAARRASGATRTATISLSHQFLTPLQIGSFATVRPRILKLTKRVAFLEGTVWCDNDPVTQAQGVWRLSASSPSRQAETHRL
ncbi:PaaI family thioesterase [Mesorhizobium australicum]|uniref:Acyl-coenzyme A thioesterase PaaI, contains HGG motif n=1 Tax=Mesorhizobium australicum TaxID=536018 RepID=A0A1X7MUT2_9HYPH|nr:Acyl-coenzyme A thioesterase PaaI, contains HGG motif [Mesorhizobium australicum]